MGALFLNDLSVTVALIPVVILWRLKRARCSIAPIEFPTHSPFWSLVTRGRCSKLAGLSVRSEDVRLARVAHFLWSWSPNLSKQRQQMQENLRHVSQLIKHLLSPLSTRREILTTIFLVKYYLLSSCSRIISAHVGMKFKRGLGIQAAHFLRTSLCGFASKWDWKGRERIKALFEAMFNLPLWSKRQG